MILPLIGSIREKNCMVERVDEFGHTTSDMGYGPKIDT